MSTLKTPEVGALAPDFSLLDQTEVVHKLSTYRGQWVLLYFYPKDDTPGCTVEACTLRDAFPKFKKIKAVVLGLSVDSPKSHQKFVDKFSLPFTLLSDTEKIVVTKYGVWGKKKFMGREYLGTNRVSFLINPDGRIIKVYPRVDPKIHAAEVLTDLQTLAK